MSSVVSAFTNSEYYMGRYRFGATTDYNKILAYFNGNPSQFSGGFDQVRSLPNDFDDSERIYARSVMNTISLVPLRLQTGLRIEAAKDSLLATIMNIDTNRALCSSSPLPPH